MTYLNKRIRIEKLAGENNHRVNEFYENLRGTVTLVDDAGQLHGTWGSIAVIPEVDKFKVIEHEADVGEYHIKLITSEFKKMIPDFSWGNTEDGGGAFFEVTGKGHSRILWVQFEWDKVDHSISYDSHRESIEGGTFTPENVTVFDAQWIDSEFTPDDCDEEFWDRCSDTDEGIAEELECSVDIIAQIKDAVNKMAPEICSDAVQDSWGDFEPDADWYEAIDERVRDDYEAEYDYYGDWLCHAQKEGKDEWC